ncbi:unnamed protein product [Staurois parvus]|uniref:Uncharacterized protein n=1 Tax=Staurois parvus TaxID=386267 RepID=A0ABN9HJD6_9NEOB|nr:unnamed protein product [Staurois parvus]
MQNQSINRCLVPLLSSAFLAAITFLSLNRIRVLHNQLHLAAALVTEGRFHTWMSSDSQLTHGPLFTMLQNMASLSPSCFSLNSVSETPPLHEYTNIYAV